MKKAFIVHISAITACVVIVLSIISMGFIASAKVYDTSFPANIPVSGGAFYACQSTLGQISVVFPYNYKDNTFGFGGAGNNVYNLTSGSISGYIYLANGTEYQARHQRQSGLEYYRPSGNTYVWTAVTVTSVTSSNIQFIDLTDLDRQTDNFDFEKHVRLELIIPFLSMALLLLIALKLFLGGRK